MTAAVLYGKEDVKIERVPIPKLEEGEVLVKVQVALTCGTDLKVYKRGYHARMIRPPAVFGHELAGTVCELGPGVSSSWRLGDRVVAANSAPCGACFFCRAGQENLCDDLLFLNGAYAETIRVPARIVEKNLVKLRPETSFADAALTEPLACVVQGIDDAAVRPGARVLILGSGPIGLMFTALLKHRGAEVFMAGRGESRLEAARRLGAARAFAAADGVEALMDCVRAELPVPPDIVMEAVGKPETWEAAVRLVRKGGTVNLFGGCPSGATVTLDTGLIHYSGLKLLASFHHTPATIRKALAAIEEGIIRAENFVNQRTPLSQLPALFRSMADGNHAIKTLVDVRG